MTIKYDYLRFIGNRALVMNPANVPESLMWVLPPRFDIKSVAVSLLT